LPVRGGLSGAGEGDGADWEAWLVVKKVEEIAWE